MEIKIKYGTHLSCEQQKLSDIPSFLEKNDKLHISGWTLISSIFQQPGHLMSLPPNSHPHRHMEYGVPWIQVGDLTFRPMVQWKMPHGSMPLSPEQKDYVDQLLGHES